MSTKLADLLAFDKSIGYDCKKLNNLCLLEPNILAFVSGNLIHFLYIDTGRVRTQRSVGNQGISYITKNSNPKYDNYLTLAECGTNPNIFVLNYPDLSIASTCDNGAQRSFACVSYNTSGELMVSQSVAPDFTLTIWDWRTSTVIFRTRSADTYVLNVRFSAHNNEQLVTGGVGHIQFWTMCRTFTGLKLSTVPGRFGHADECNVMGFCVMPDRKTLSNSAWGNILVWATDGHIKFEVCQKNRMPCHRAAISQIICDDGDVMTVGQDGYVRVWFWKTVDLAEPSEEQPFVEVDPTFEYFVGSEAHTCQLLSMIRGTEERCWYAQDGNGGIWKCDFRSIYDGKCEMLYRCHAGGVVALACSPYTAHMVTLGVDGRAHLYDYEGGTLLGFHQFPAGGRDMLWVPREVDASAVVILAAFEDGVIRMFCVNVAKCSFHLIQAIKSHSDAVNKILLGIRESVLVSGSDDHTIFVHQIIQRKPYICLSPIALIKMSEAVTALEWNYLKEATVFVGCSNGDLTEVVVPTITKSYEDVTYVLSHSVQRRIQLRLPSISSECEAQSPGKILWLKAATGGKIHMAMAGVHSGHVYEFNVDTETHSLTSLLIDKDAEISSILNLPDHTIIGLSNGKMSVRPPITTSFTSTESHIINLHNNLYGRITSIGVSYDRRYLISVGLDGNIFTFTMRSDMPLLAYPPRDFVEPSHVVDIMAASHLSLEEQKKQSHRDERIHLINKKKSQMLEVLAMLKDDFASIKSRNDALPESQRLCAENLELDRRITEDMEKDFARAMDLMRSKMAFDVEKSRLLMDKVETCMTSNLECWPVAVRGIRSAVSVETFRIAKTSEEFRTINASLEAQIAVSTDVRNSITAQNVNRLMDVIESSSTDEQESTSEHVKTVLQNLISSTDEGKFDLQMKRLLKKYRERKREEAERKRTWQYINQMVPDPDILDPNDIQALKTAEETIGNYRLKTDPEFIPTEDDISTAAKKYKQLLSVKEEIYALRNEYNARIFCVSQKRIALCEFIEQQNTLLMTIHAEIPSDKVQHLKEIPAMDNDAGVPDAFVRRHSVKLTEICIERVDIPVAHDHTRIVVDALKNYQREHDRSEGEAHRTWEQEFMTVRQTERLFQQSRLIADVNCRIDAFDSEIIELHKARMDVDIKTKFLETFFLTLYQELWILRDFEEIETKLLAQIAAELTKCEEIKLEYLGEKANADSRLANIRECKEEVQSIQMTLRQECAGSKHEKYLIKLFRMNSGSHSPQSTEDCESSGEFSVGASVDADTELVEMVKEMRQQRMALEKRISKEMAALEQSTTKMDDVKRALDMIEANLQDHNEKLKNFGIEMQNMLNNVETLAVIRFDQMHYFTNETEMYEIEDTVIVNHDTMSKLFQRVGQLGFETIDEQRKHRIYKMHLARLKSDCHFMNGQILELKDKTDSKLMKKFGAVVDLDEMEESILKKYLLNVQGNVEAIDSEYHAKSNELKKLIVQKEVDYLKAKQGRIEKMHVLTALQEEKNLLDEAIGYQNKIETMLSTAPPVDFGVDLTRLKEICHQQQDQLKLLQKEIQALRLKAKPFDPHPPRTLQPLADYSNIFYDQQSIDGGTRPSSTHSSVSRVTNIADDTNGVRKVMTIVEHFLGKCVAMHMDAATLQLHAKKISHYLVQVISNYDVENVDVVTRCVVENLKGFLPKRALRYIQTRDLAQLFGDVLQIYGDDEDNFTIDELMDNILTELKSKVPRHSPDYSGLFVCEFVEDILAVLPLEEVSKGHRVSEMANALRKATDLDRKSIDATKIAAEVSAYFGNSIGSHMNTKDLNRFIDDLVSNLSTNSSEQSNKKTKP